MNKLFVRVNGEWHEREDFPTYRAAVESGQLRAPNNFYVDTGNRIPTEAEQLGLYVPPPSKTKRQQTLDSI